MQAIRFAGDRPLAVRTFPALRLVVAFVAPSAADEGPRGIGHRWVRVEAAVDGAFFGSDAIQGAALTKETGL
jgi:hypothetical protein